jgi:hypothetical protein
LSRPVLPEIFRRSVGATLPYGFEINLFWKVSQD